MVQLFSSYCYAVLHLFQGMIWCLTAL